MVQGARLYPNSMVANLRECQNCGERTKVFPHRVTGRLHQWRRGRLDNDLVNVNDIVQICRTCFRSIRGLTPIKDWLGDQPPERRHPKSHESVQGRPLPTPSKTVDELVEEIQRLREEMGILKGWSADQAEEE